MVRLQCLIGLLAMLAIAWAMSERRRKPPLRLIVTGLCLQLAIGLVLLRVPLFQKLFLALNHMVLALESATAAGTGMVFGYLGGGPLPFEAVEPANLFVLAFRALPLVLVISALSALLFYWRILPLLVRGFAWCLARTLGIGGAEGLGVAGNLFVGMVEAPLSIRPYLAPDDPQRTVCVDDRRHGHYCRNGDGALCLDPGQRHSGCHGAHPNGIDHQCAGGRHHRQNHDTRVRSPHRRPSGHSGRGPQQYGRHHPGNATGGAAVDQYRGHAGGAGRAGSIWSISCLPCCPIGTAGRSPCSASSA